MADQNMTPNTTTTQPAATTSVNYASFGTRLLAVILDAILLGVVGFALGLVIGATMGAESGKPVINGLSYLISWTYLVVMDIKYGATVGKLAMKIRVQNIDTGANLTIMEAILREVLGKFVSGIVLGLGYLWMLWDPKKQTWHDKLGKSIVIKIG